MTAVKMKVLKLKLFLSFIAIAATIFAAQADAMTFQIRDGSIYASDEIVAGDAARFRAITAGKASILRRNKFGMVEMYLNSLGGNVDEALAMAGVMDEIGMVTIVPAGSSCASACASILFLSGRMRHSDGMLGFHSCRRAGDPTMAKYHECNVREVEFISKHLSNSSAAAFFTIVVEPSDMEWFNGPTAHCLGLDAYNNGYVRLGDNPCQGADQLYAIGYSYDPSKFPRRDGIARSRQPWLMLVACKDTAPIKGYLKDRANYASSISDPNAGQAWATEHFAALQRDRACVRLADDSESSFKPLDANLGPAVDTQFADGTAMHNVYVKGLVRGRIMYSTYMFDSGEPDRKGVE